MKKKLLFLIVKFDNGGTEKVTYDLITHLNPEKYDITLMTMYNGGGFQNQLPEYVHIKYFFPKFIRFVIRYVTLVPAKLVYRTFIHDKYDVEIACGDDIPSRVINHSTNKSSKKISWIHMDVINRGYQGYEMKTESGRKKFYKNFDTIVNVSFECEKKFKEKFGNNLPTKVIYNPVDIENIKDKSQERPLINLPKNVFNIVCIGRFTPQKGFDRVVEAYNSLKKEKIMPCQITILGDGYERSRIQEMIDNYGLENDILLLGHVDNPYSILKQADLFLLASRDESFSLVVAEAMVLGIPVMSTRCAGPTELLKNGEAGYLVENSLEGIQNGLRKVFLNPEMLDPLKRKALNSIDRFCIDNQIKIIEDILD